MKRRWGLPGLAVATAAAAMAPAAHADVWSTNLALVFAQDGSQPVSGTVEHAQGRFGSPDAPEAQPIRPDINPYDRDIAITVPLNFNQRVLGDLPVVLTRDDRFIVDSAGFKDLIDPLLTPEAQAELALAVAASPSFAPEEINATGIQLDYDPDQLAVLVLRIDPTKRSVEDLFQGGRAEDPEMGPEPYSAYMNLNAAVQRRASTGDITAPSIFLNGGLRFRSVVFEADLQGREEPSTGEYLVDRRYARLVYDQPEAYRRWSLGDLEVDLRGRQGFVELGGLGVTRQRQRFQAFRQNSLAGGRQLILQEGSTVRVSRNGVFMREFRLDPGQYDLTNLPLETGSNDVQIEIVNDSGRVETVNYSAYLDAIDLEPGDYEYAAYLGITNESIFGSPDYSDGQLAFSGFYRKAFVNRPAIGIGLQVSEDVLNLIGQTQLILKNGARLRLDTAMSNADVGAGYAYAISFDHLLDRNGTFDSWNLIVDYTSEDFANLGSPLGQNPISWIVTAGYTRRFSDDWFGTASASYRVSRSASLDNSYILAATTTYRFTPEWSVQIGAEYTDFGDSFGRSTNGDFGATVALVWQPRFDRRAEARYNTARNTGSVRYQQIPTRSVDAWGYSVAADYNDGPGSVSGQVDYIGNRFDASLAHAIVGRDFRNLGDEQVTSLRLGTAIAAAGGKVAIGRSIYDSFAIVYPHETLKDAPVIVGESLAGGNYSARSGAFGPALSNQLSSYVNQSIRYDALNAPVGYDVGEGVLRVHPTYKSGYVVEVGSASFVSALGRLVGNEGKPAGLLSGNIVPVDQPDAEPALFFTNSVGRFAIQDLEPGKRYRVNLYSNPPLGFEFTVPADTDGLLDLHVVTIPLDVLDDE